MRPDTDEQHVPPPEDGSDAPAPEAGSAEGGAPSSRPDPAAWARLTARAAEADVLEDRLKRAQAEFVNESRRIARQAEQDRRFAVEDVVKDLVPLAEGLAAALLAVSGVPEGDPLRGGVALVSQQLEALLQRYGIELIRPVGQAFDPSAHEALMMVERADLPAGQVAAVVRPGFRLHGRVVRPAQVTVAKAPGAAAAPST